MAVDGHLNDWEDFKPEASNVYKCFRDRIKGLLLATPDTMLRNRLNNMFDLSVYVNVFDNDSKRAFCPEQKQQIPFRRRTVRRRSSSGQTFRYN